MLIVLVLPLSTVTAFSSTDDTLNSSEFNITTNTVDLDTIGQDESQFKDTLGVSDENSLAELGTSLKNVEAFPTVNGTLNSTKENTSTNNTAVLDTIGQEESQFEDVQGVSDEASMIQLGYGDCWADSEWLYNKLTAAGIQTRIMGYENDGTGIGYRHTWIEINTGNGWQMWNYTKYNSQHYGDVGTDVPFVLIGPGNPDADILSTGY